MRRALILSAMLCIIVAISACGVQQDRGATNSESFEQTLAAHAQCLQDRGWTDAAYDEPGSLTVSVPAGQEEQYENDDEFCKQEAGVKQVDRSISLSAESLSRLYELELETSQCLKTLGYDTGEPPSKQSFIDDYQSGGGWIAYGQLPDMDAAEFREVSEKCPQAAFKHGDELWNEIYSEE